jgi:hypothetical protein
LKSVDGVDMPNTRKTASSLRRVREWLIFPKVLYFIVGLMLVLLGIGWGADRLGFGKTAVAASFDYPPEFPG